MEPRRLGELASFESRRRIKNSRQSRESDPPRAASKVARSDLSWLARYASKQSERAEAGSERVEGWLALVLSVCCAGHLPDGDR